MTYACLGWFINKKITLKLQREGVTIASVHTYLTYKYYTYREPNPISRTRIYYNTLCVCVIKYKLRQQVSPELSGPKIRNAPVLTDDSNPRIIQSLRW